MQRLADRAGEATKRVEAVAQALHGETRALVAALEQAAVEADDGAAWAGEAVAIAQELEQGATALADRVVRLGEHAQAQADGASVLAAAMGTLRENTRHVAEVIQQAAAAVAQLDSQLDDVRHSTAGFKLTV
jgi:twitching motility protein PilJ